MRSKKLIAAMVLACGLNVSHASIVHSENYNISFNHEISVVEKIVDSDEISSDIEFKVVEHYHYTKIDNEISSVPLPTAAWLSLSGILFILYISKRRNHAND